MSFPRTWQAEILTAPPLIAPARQYTWPVHVPGEEDALARGALQLLVRTAETGAYLVTCAQGFSDASLPTGVWGCPRAEEICAVAGGYAYLADSRAPGSPTLLALKPVTAVVEAAGMLVFAGFHTLAGWGRGGLAWQTRRVSWDGIVITGVDEAMLSGTGWDLMADAEVPFTLDLRTGEVTGGGYRV